MRKVTDKVIDKEGDDSWEPFFRRKNSTKDAIKASTKVHSFRIQNTVSELAGAS